MLFRSRVPVQLMTTVSTLLLNYQAEKTRSDYERVKKKYEEFREGRPHSTPLVEAFIVELSKSLAPTTLWTNLSHVCKYLELEEHFQVDRTSINRLLKKMSEKHTKKKAPAFSREEIFQYLEQTPNEPAYLSHKLFVLITFFCALRISEAEPLKFSDFELDGAGLKVSFVRKKTVKNGETQTCLIPASSIVTRDPVTIFTTFRAIAEQYSVDGNIWVRYNSRYQHFTHQKIGHNILRKYSEDVATFLGKPNPHLFTSHSFRSSSATVLADMGISALNLKRHGGWRSDSTSEEYLRKSKHFQLTVANLLSGNEMITPGSNSSQEFPNSDEMGIS